MVQYTRNEDKLISQFQWTTLHMFAFQSVMKASELLVFLAIVFFTEFRE